MSEPAFTGQQNAGFEQKHPRRKSDWAGIGMGDAFKTSVDYYSKVTAQGLFYRRTGAVQRRVAGLLGHATDSRFQARAQPQLSPFFTDYPAALAAYAAIGHTAFLELKARIGNDILFERLGSYLADPATEDEVTCDPVVYKQVAFQVTEAVQTRLFLEDLARIGEIPEVERYRLFAAAQESLRFVSLNEILRVYLLYGDLLPDRSQLDLHPMTRELLSDLEQVSTPYFLLIADADGEHLLRIGEGLVRNLCRRLASRLPLPVPPQPTSPPAAKGSIALLMEQLYDDLLDEQLEQLQRHFGNKPAEPGPGERLAPLDGPSPPSLHEPENAGQVAAGALGGDATEHMRSSASASSGNARVEKALNRLAQATEAAAKQPAWHDMRSDRLSRTLRNQPFQPGPMEGNPAQGHEIKLPLAGNKQGVGAVFDRPLALSNDRAAWTRLHDEALPLIDALRRNLYPDLREQLQFRRLRGSGALDPARLHLAGISDAVYRRLHVGQSPDRGGRPLLVIACDGSGSLNPPQMRMLKLLTTAWLVSTARSDVQVMAALYHSGMVRPGLTSPLVQWIHHPYKMTGLGTRDATRALASLPGRGTGVQSDALSVAFIMEEAGRIARGGMIYLVLISDTAWNRSFRTEQNGLQEMVACLQELDRRFGDRLHKTLVGLGVEKETGLEYLLDAVLGISGNELKDPAVVARRINRHIVSRIRRTPETGAGQGPDERQST